MSKYGRDRATIILCCNRSTLRRNRSLAPPSSFKTGHRGIQIRPMGLETGQHPDFDANKEWSLLPKLLPN